LEEKDREVAKLEKELLEKEGELNDIRWEKKESPGKGSTCWVPLGFF